MREAGLALPILIPLVAGILVLLIPDKLRRAKETIAVLASLANLIIAVRLFGKGVFFSLPWAGFGIDFSLNLDRLSSFILLAVSTFGFLIAVYSCSFMRRRNCLRQFYCYYLVCLSFVCGAVLSNNLLLMLFFWEGMLGVIFGMIAIGNKDAFRTALKAFIIIAIADLCLMLGIALTGYLSSTFEISKIRLPLTPLAGVAFVFLMIGAISKSGAMPFHTWIPDAATDAPLPFMAFLPGALEKLLGIYFLVRISTQMFDLVPDSKLSFILMGIGAITIICAVMMALIQKDYKRLLSYHAISQVGYMILGIGTAVPVGIIGGLFHMLNNAMYKSCLFLTGGAVEKQAGTTDLEKLGGLARKMPVTFACFLVAAVSISGVPPFNGFFSKELVYDAALERGFIFYAAALLGSFFTAASFLKLGHAAYFGKKRQENEQVKEASWPMLIPMIVIAAGCVLFGVFNGLPLNKLIQPALSAKLGGHDYSGFPANIWLIVITVIVLIAALINHLFGVKINGSGLKAVDHIHYAPGLKKIYDLAEKRYFDPYDIGLKVVGVFSSIFFRFDRAIDWIYNNLSVKAAYSASESLRRMHNGNYVVYLGWSLLGLVFMIIFLVSTK
ncbi:MAG: NADH-quinone oxidoreductase subunit L [Candidatus Omnitrophica bacterium]|nr:NADH-quinone oxidoreductase subunit L [Candidatus Omnitrophota bacterium]